MIDSKYSGGHCGSFVIRGDICDVNSPTELDTVENGYAVCVDGVSKGVFRHLPAEYRDLPLEDWGGMLVIPGLVDLHIHAPQYAFRGMGMDMELMQWLQQQTFPEEAKYAGMDYARYAYELFAGDMKRSATTHACIFGTIHTPATELLMDLMDETGLVSYVGKVNMDRGAPDNLREGSAMKSSGATVGWLEEIGEKYRRTQPVLTPRFVPSCSEELLDQLGAIQRVYNLPVQSHLSENPEEIETVRQLCPEAACYADVYHRHRLLGLDSYGEFFPTVMAHCVYSDEEERALLRENGVFVAHCPGSNTNLASGIAPVRKFLREGIRVGLGSDVAGGHTASILRAACDAVQMSKLYWRLVDSNDPPLSFREAFYLAARGGGAFFGNVGSFEPGFVFTAVALDDRGLRAPFPMSVEQRLERAAYSALDLYALRAKYVEGERVV